MKPTLSEVGIRGSASRALCACGLLQAGGFVLLGLSLSA